MGLLRIWLVVLEDVDRVRDVAVVVLWVQERAVGQLQLSDQVFVEEPVVVVYLSRVAGVAGVVLLHVDSRVVQEIDNLLELRRVQAQHDILELWVRCIEEAGWNQVGLLRCG